MLKFLNQNLYGSQKEYENKHSIIQAFRKYVKIMACLMYGGPHGESCSSVD